jgi:hypothetical protein
MEGQDNFSEIAKNIHTDSFTYFANSPLLVLFGTITLILTLLRYKNMDRLHSLNLVLLIFSLWNYVYFRETSADVIVPIFALTTVVNVLFYIKNTFLKKK